MLLIICAVVVKRKICGTHILSFGYPELEKLQKHVATDNHNVNVSCITIKKKSLNIRGDAFFMKICEKKVQNKQTNIVNAA